LVKQVAELKNEVATLEAESTQQNQVASTTPSPGVGLEEKPLSTTTPAPSTSGTSTKHQSLINELQKLADDKVYMKQGSQGTRVGTVQNFLNIYNKTSKKIDNDYGAGTKKDVAAFQKAQGLTADGEAGPTTFSKMVAWLKKQ
jgi:mannosyl-glycoprotein endo-beta-N-acetylglucosaminidase